MENEEQTKIEAKLVSTIQELVDIGRYTLRVLDYHGIENGFFINYSHNGSLELLLSKPLRNGYCNEKFCQLMPVDDKQESIIEQTNLEDIAREISENFKTIGFDEKMRCRSIYIEGGK